MAKVGKALESVLQGYTSFLRERMLAPPKHQPHLVRWRSGSPCSLRRNIAVHVRVSARPVLIGDWRASWHQVVADPAGGAGDSLGNPRRKRSTDG